MDNIYQAVKGLCKAIMNLLVAVVDLLAGILNGIACLFEKIKPHASRQFQEIRENGGLKFGTYAKKDDAEKSPKKFPAGAGNKSFDEAKVQAVREELTKKVINRDTYDLAYSEASYNGQNRCQMTLAAMLALLGIIVLLGATGVSNAGRGVLIVVLLIAGAAACTVIYSGKKIRQKNALIRLILEQEFAEYQTVVQAEESQPEKKDIAAVEQVTEPKTEQETEQETEPVGAEPVTEPETQIKVVPEMPTEPLEENKAVNA